MVNGSGGGGAGSLTPHIRAKQKASDRHVNALAVRIYIASAPVVAYVIVKAGKQVLLPRERALLHHAAVAYRQVIY